MTEDPPPIGRPAERGPGRLPPSREASEGGEGRAAEPLTEQRIDFAYTVYWMKTARQWEADRRRQIAEQVGQVIASPEFLNNAFQRKFQIDELDSLAHSGASLIALQKVLQALGE